MDITSFPWWLLMLFGALIWELIRDFVMPDRISVWLSLRRNSWWALVLVLVVALVFGVGNLLIAAVNAIARAFGPAIAEMKENWEATSFAPWVMPMVWLAIATIVILTIWYIVVRTSRRRGNGNSFFRGRPWRGWFPNRGTND